MYQNLTKGRHYEIFSPQIHGFTRLVLTKIPLQIDSLLTCLILRQPRNQIFTSQTRSPHFRSQRAHTSLLRSPFFFARKIFNIPFIQTLIRSRPTLDSPNLNRSGERTGRLPRRPRELSGVGDGGVAGAS